MLPSMPRSLNRSVTFRLSNRRSVPVSLISLKCAASPCRPMLRDFITLPADDIVKSTN